MVNTLFDKAGRGDVIKLIAAYEASLFNNAQIHSTNGYEARRQNAFADIGSSKLKAAAAASAIALVTTKLAPGQSTDGAVFYPNQGKPLGSGKADRQYGGRNFRFSAGRCADDCESALRSLTRERSPSAQFRTGFGELRAHISQGRDFAERRREHGTRDFASVRLAIADLSLVPAARWQRCVSISTRRSTR